MKHRVKKMRFGRGYDFNKMMVRKLSVNFFLKGHLSTTLARLKIIKPFIETLISKMKKETISNKNYLLKILNDPKVVRMGFDNFGKVIAKVNGGYLRIIKYCPRNSDGSEFGRLEWAYPIVIETVKAIKKVEPKKATPVKPKTK